MRAGSFEIPRFRLKVGCSASELRPLYWVLRNRGTFEAASNEAFRPVSELVAPESEGSDAHDSGVRADETEGRATQESDPYWEFASQSL